MDVDTMCGNTWLSVTQETCVPHYQMILKLMACTMSSVKHMTDQKAFGKLCLISLQQILASTKKDSIENMFPKVKKNVQYDTL